jgi:hypothetical protein
MNILVWLILFFFTGNGDGLRFRVFDASNRLIVTDTLSVVGFDAWYNCSQDTTALLDKKICNADSGFSVIMDGFIEALGTEEYTFSYNTSGSASLSIGGSPIANGGRMVLIAGQKVPIIIQFKNLGYLETDCGGFELKWRSNNLGNLTDIPTSQLYTGLNTTLPIKDKPIDRTPIRVVKELKVQTMVDGSIWVESPKKFTYLLTDVVGRELQRGFLYKDANYIPVAKFAPGIYILSINNEVTYRIVKKR